MGVLQVIPENIHIHIHILQQATSQNPEGEGGGGCLDWNAEGIGGGYAVQNSKFMGGSALNFQKGETAKSLLESLI